MSSRFELAKPSGPVPDVIVDVLPGYREDSILRSIADAVNGQFRSGVRMHINGYRISLDSSQTLPQSFNGGTHISERSIAKYRELYPLIDLWITETDGKIVYPGNGLSLVPLFRHTEVQKPARFSPDIVVDAISYPALLSDLEYLYRQMVRYDAPISLRTSLKDTCASVIALLDGQDRGYISLEQYIVGTGKPPTTVFNADLVISIMGPSTATLDEQLSFLAPQGTLFICATDPEYRTAPTEYKSVRGYTHSRAGFLHKYTKDNLV